MSHERTRGRRSSPWTREELQEAIRTLKRSGVHAVMRNGILVDGSSIIALCKMPAAEKLRRLSLMMQALPRRDETPEELAELEEARVRWVGLTEAFNRREKAKTQSSSMM